MSNLKTFGFNQKNFNGSRPVPNVAIRLGATRGKGSSTRMFNYCTQHSSAPSLCINQFINIAAASPSPEEDILFNISTFNNLFDYDNSGTPKKLPQKYIDALIYAANRWNKFIKMAPGMISLMKKYVNPDWKGIELYEVEYFISTNYAATIPYVYKSTTMCEKFKLEINDTDINSFSQDFLNDLFTHELGHALGFAEDWDSRIGGEPNGQELLPKIQRLTLYETDPNGIEYNTWASTINAYNSYNGTCTWQKTPYPEDSFTMPFGLGNGHLYSTSQFSKETVPVPPAPNPDTSAFVKRGFARDIMIPGLNKSLSYYISEVDLTFLCNLYTQLEGNTKQFNYIRKNESSEVKNPIFISNSYLIYYNGSKSVNITRETNLKAGQVLTCGGCRTIHFGYT